MCGRFALGLPHDEIQQMHGYNVHVGEWVGQDHFVPRYNVAPRSQAPVIRRRDDEGSSSAGNSSGQPGPSSGPSMAGGTADQDASTSAKLGSEPGPSTMGEPVSVFMQTMRWGLVPHWSKHEDSSLKTINARCEALIEEPRGMWASIKGKKRCAVVCQGYYEWLKKGKDRLPHFTKPKEDRLMLLAGLWDCVTLEGSNEPLWTFTIVTTDANKEFSWLHDRQPVILPDEHALSVWLDTSPGKWTAQLSKLCAPYASTEHGLACYQVPKEVGKIGTESPTFVQPIAEREDGIEAMFAKQLRKQPSTTTRSNPRKRSGSPSEARKGEAKKKAKVISDNGWQDDSDIELIDDPAKDKNPAPATPKRGRAKPAGEEPPKTPKAVRKSTKASPPKSAAAQPSKTTGKITSFFTKK